MANPTAKDRQKLARWVKKCQRVLLLTHWTTELVYQEDSDPTSKPGSMTLASVNVDTVYTHMRINVWPEFWSEAEEVQKSTILHELTHGPVYPLGVLAIAGAKTKKDRQNAETTEEQLTQWFTNVVTKLIK